MERTFAIIKPDAFSAGNTGKIISRIVGSKEWASAEAIQLVEKLLAQ